MPEDEALFFPTPAAQRRVFGLCWITYAGYYLGRVNLAVALPLLAAELALGKGAAGLIGGAFYWCYALGQLYHGALGDRVSARRLVTAGLLASAALNLLFSRANGLALLVALWALNGWAQSTGWGPMIRTLAHWFSPQQRGRLTAFFSPCYVLGHALSWALAGWLVTRSGWRASFWVPGLLLVLLAALWAILARDAPPGTPRAPLGPAKESARPWTMMRGALMALWRERGLRWALLTCFLSGMIKDGLTLWGPTYLMEQQALSLPQAALSALFIPLAGMAGAMAAGWLAHRHPLANEARAVLPLALLLGGAALGLYLLAATPLRFLAVALLGLCAFGSHGINALLMTSLPLALGHQGRASTTAGTFDFVSYAGGGLSAALVGATQERLGWGAVFALWAGVALAMSALARHRQR
jgi:OPA family glycerol-3-phosphate transporter-like MFS transporter